MAINTRNVTKMYEKEVFTDDCMYFGNVEEALVTSNKVSGWRVKATKKSYLTKVLGGAKGVIVPHQYVRAVGDVVIISRGAIPSYDEKEEEA